MKRYLQCAEQQVSLAKLTKYCAWHTKWLILVTYETLFTMRGTADGILQHHRILRLPRKLTLETFPKISRKLLKCHFQCGADPSRIRPWSEHETVTPQPASQPRLLFTPTTSILYWKIQHFALRLSFQISPNTAPATKSDTSTSPNTAPGTQNDCHDWSSSHMKRYLQCAEQQASLSKLIKYCACHAKWLSKILQKILENRWNVNCNARPIRDRSENDPSMKPSLRNPPRNRGYFSRPPRAFCIEKYNISRSGYHSKFHRILRLPRKVTLQLHRILRLPRKMTLQLHQILRLPRKMTLMINPRHTWNAIYNARNNRWHPPTSPNTAPATPNDSPKFQKHFSKTDETSITMRDRSETVPRMIRAWSENDPSMKPSLRNPPRNRGYFSRPPRALSPIHGN